MANEFNFNLKTIGGEEIVGNGDIPVQDLSSSDSIKIENGQAKRKALTGDVEANENQNVTTIKDKVVTNEKMGNVASGIIKGRKAAGNGPVQDLNVSDVLILLGLSNAMHYKGSIASYAALKAQNNVTYKKGDIYNMIDTGQNYAFSGTNNHFGTTTDADWDKMGTIVDMSLYYTKTQVDAALDEVPTDVNDLTDNSNLLNGDLHELLSKGSSTQGLDIGISTSSVIKDATGYNQYDPNAADGIEITANSNSSRKKLFTNSGIRRKTRISKNSTNIETSDHVLFVDNGVTITLPSEKTIGDEYIIILRTANDVIIQSSDKFFSKSFNNVTSFTINNYQKISIISDGTNWYVNT